MSREGHHFFLSSNLGGLWPIPETSKTKETNNDKKESGEVPENRTEGRQDRGGVLRHVVGHTDDERHFVRAIAVPVGEGVGEKRIETANFRILASSCTIPSRTATVDSTDEQRPGQIDPQRRKQVMTHDTSGFLKRRSDLKGGNKWVQSTNGF